MFPFRLARPTGRPLRVVCLGAHADDLEIGCGGTLLRLKEAYPESSVQWVVFSANAVRAAEARRGAELFLTGLSAPDVRVLNFRDGFFPSRSEALKDYFETDLKPLEPDLVFTHYRHDRHQDHRVLADLAWNTFRRALILEYEVHKYDGDLGQPNLYVPLDEATARQKADLILQAFESQHARHWFGAEAFGALLRVRGVEAGVRYAEAFYARKLTWEP